MNIYSESSCLIQIENVSVTYGAKTIIRNMGTANIPFNIMDVHRAGINQGQIVALLGRSGRGKSTFFKCLSGLIQPSTGHIKIPSNNTGQYTPVTEGDVGFVQQFYPLSRNQTVCDMLKDAAKQGKHTGRAATDLINKYIEDWGLVPQKHLYTNQLSGGQKQRVAIIEQLLCSHHFIILDEPFSGLDVVNIEDVKESIHKLTQQNEMNTVIFSTHQIEIATALADSIYVMGYEYDAQNNPIDGGTILSHYDLKKMGIAWSEFSQQHYELTQKIKAEMMKS
jgi:ABC-type multidrug transport system ATPase subunit